MLSFGLKNLRRIKEVPPIPIKPITILVGRNSSGKSTFLRSMPLLRQSLTTRTSSPILWYGDWVDFNSFDDAVYENNCNNIISFNIGLDNVRVDRTAVFDEFGGYQFFDGNPGNFSFSADISIKKHNSGTRINSIEFAEKMNESKISLKVSDDFFIESILADNIDLTTYLGKHKLKIQSDSIIPYIYFYNDLKTENDITVKNVFHNQRQLRKIVSDQIKRIVRPRVDGRTTRGKTFDSLIDGILNSSFFNHQTLKEISDYSTNSSWKKYVLNLKEPNFINDYTQIKALFSLYKLPNWFGSFSNNAKSAMSSVLYIGPARAKSDRYYRYQDLAVSEIDPDGKNFPMFLNSLNKNQIDKFSSWVKKLFNYGVSVTNESGHISIKIIYPHSSVNIVDTGYGVSQILPVLGQVWWANNKPHSARERLNNKDNIILAIEQPELHLHPAHQAMLADVFSYSIKSQSPDREHDRSIAFIIETHSETLINRLGTLIAEKELSHDDVQIVIFEENQEESRTTSTRLVNYDEDGFLIDWPYGFFTPSVGNKNDN